MTDSNLGQLNCISIKSWGRSDATGTCYVTEEQLIRWRVGKGARITLGFGSYEARVLRKLVPSEAVGINDLYLSEDVIRLLHLPHGYHLGIQGHGNHLILGPLLGLFVHEEKLLLLAEGENKNPDERIYVETAKGLGGLLCFFSEEDISWEQGLVRAVVPVHSDKGRGFTTMILPLPKVIYDRCYGPKGREKARNLRNQLHLKPNITVFNCMEKLTKWETYRVLHENPGLRQNLPGEIVYHSPKDLDRALKKWTQVYVKPDSLSKGQGVFRVSRYQNQIKVEQRQASGNKTTLVKSSEEIKGILSPYKKKGGGYVIQQKVDLAKYLGNPFDLRVLCQKNEHGEWGIGGIVARIAASGSVITSPRSGGQVAAWPVVLKKVFNQSDKLASGVHRQLWSVAKKVCEEIERQYGCCGELGLDLAVDRKGQVWVIEVNGKPLKVSLNRLAEPKITREIYANPIKYAWYLASKV